MFFFFWSLPSIKSVIMSLWQKPIILLNQCSDEHKDTGLWMCFYCSLVAVLFVILFEFVLNLSHCMNRPRDADVWLQPKNGKQHKASSLRTRQTEIHLHKLYFFSFLMLASIKCCTFPITVFHPQVIMSCQTGFRPVWQSLVWPWIICFSSLHLTKTSHLKRSGLRSVWRPFAYGNVGWGLNKLLRTAALNWLFVKICDFLKKPLRTMC